MLAVVLHLGLSRLGEPLVLSEVGVGVEAHLVVVLDVVPSYLVAVEHVFAVTTEHLLAPSPGRGARLLALKVDYDLLASDVLRLLVVCLHTAVLCLAQHRRDAA